LRTWAVLGGLVGMMLLPAVRRRTMAGLLRIPLVSRLAVRSVMRNRWLRNRLMQQALKPVMKAAR